MKTTTPVPTTPAAPRRELSLFDSTCIIAGIIIGVGIYRSTPDIAGCVPSAGWLIGVWVLGGLFAMIGALCYAELGTAYPTEGGDYVYLTRAFDRPMGFLFAWSELWVVRPGSIGAMAFVFAEYANSIWPNWTPEKFFDEAGKPRGATLAEALIDPARQLQVAYAAGAFVVLTIINMLGIKQGKWTQNILTTAKFAGLVAVVVVGFSYSTAPADAPAVATYQIAEHDTGVAVPDWSLIGLAMIFVLFTYGGWNEMGYVGAEVRNPEKNIFRALVFGTVAVTAIYVLVNLAFLHAVGLEGMRKSTVATDVLALALGKQAGIAISVLICVSALGVVNGQIFTGSRIYYAMGKDHALYAPLSRWNARVDAPLVSLAVQAIITLALVVGFGLTGNGFNKLVIFTAPPFWFFLFLVAMSVLVFRAQQPNLRRPYRVFAYPLTPLLLAAGCLYMIYSSVSYAVANRSSEAFWAIGIVAVGVALSFVRNGKAVNSHEGK